jgi:hypothetical protein
MNSNDELEKYRYIWGSTAQWALVAGVIPCTKVVIEFEGESPNPREIVALRKVVDHFRDKSLSDIKTQIGHSKYVDVGRFTGYQLHFLVPEIQEHGFSVQLINESYTGYIPYHPGSGHLLTILALQDRTIFTQIVQKLLLKGVPIYDMPFEID